jgi:GTP-binding protein
VTIDTRDEHIGIISEMMGKRQGQMTDMRKTAEGETRLEFRIPTKGLIGLRSTFLTATRGQGVMNTTPIGWEPWKGDILSTRSGVLVAAEPGTAVTYGLNNAQGRGITFIEPNTQVYEGMIVGQTPRSNDIAINVCKEKKKTNIRSSTSDIAIKLTPPVLLSLEQAIDFINDDELVEVTPSNIRLRKKILTETMRLRGLAHARKAAEDAV